MNKFIAYAISYMPLVAYNIYSFYFDGDSSINYTQAIVSGILALLGYNLSSYLINKR
jgi:hypothetical protein